MDYLRGAPRADEAESPDGIDPYWLLLPAWLPADSRVANRIRRRRAFLRDILWAQYCVFLYVRLLDDVLDGDSATASMPIVGSALLMEAERTFARHVDVAPFREFLRGAIADTCDAGLRIDAMQRSGGAGRDALRAYAAAAAIFKVGTAAVCIAGRRTSALPWLYRFADAIAVAAQIMDDIRDLDADLKRGRVNYAAARLGPDLARGIFCDDGIGALADEVDRHLRRAARAASRARLGAAVAYAERVRAELSTFRATLRRAHVEHWLRPQLTAARYNQPQSL
jgi:hypothetical protein